MVFQLVIERLSLKQQSDIRHRLTTLGSSSAIGRQIEQNVGLESKLPHKSAEAIVIGLLATSDEPNALQNEYSERCLQHTLKGPTIRGVRPVTLGRAIVLEAFCERLVRDHGFRSMKAAEAWVKRRCKSGLAALRKAFKETPLGGKVVWATFTEPHRDVNPFLRLPKAAIFIHDALGLDPKSRGQPLLLFVYSPPPDLDLRFPTVADAQWGRLFRPAIDDPTCECGLTAPPTDDPNCKPLPELVHEQVNGDILSEAIRVLR